MIQLRLQIRLTSALNAIEILDPVLKLGRSFWLGIYPFTNWFILVLLYIQGPLLLVMCILGI
jgi:hypothetical protein